MTYEEWFHNRTLDDIMEEYGEQRNEWHTVGTPEITHFSLPTEAYAIPCKLFAPYVGKPRGVIVGVHGFAGDKDSSVLFHLAYALCKHDYALVSFDFPAHGKSTAPDEALRVVNCKRDLCLVAQWVKETYPDVPYGVFATSFGGYITSLCADPLQGFKKVLRAPAVTMAAALEKMVSPLSKEELLRNGADCGFERKMHVSGAFYRELRECPFVDPDERVLVIHGTEDDVIPFAAVEELAARCDNVRLIAVEGADHRFKREQDLARILRESVSWFLET